MTAWAADVVIGGSFLLRLSVVCVRLHGVPLQDFDFASDFISSMELATLSYVSQRPSVGEEHGSWPSVVVDRHPNLYHSGRVAARRFAWVILFDNSVSSADAKIIDRGELIRPAPEQGSGACSFVLKRALRSVDGRVLVLEPRAGRHQARRRIRDTNVRAR